MRSHRHFFNSRCWPVEGSGMTPGPVGPHTWRSVPYVLVHPRLGGRWCPVDWGLDSEWATVAAQMLCLQPLGLSRIDSITRLLFMAAIAVGGQIWDAAGTAVGLKHSLGSRREQQGTTADFGLSAHTLPSVIAYSPSGRRGVLSLAEGCFAGFWYVGIENNRTGVLPPWTLGRCRCRDGIGALWCVGACLAGGGDDHLAL